MQAATPSQLALRASSEKAKPPRQTAHRRLGFCPCLSQHTPSLPTLLLPQQPAWYISDPFVQIVASSILQHAFP